eukprot:XP_008671112.1 protein KOKOPELLI [Zea mays]
MDKTVSLPCSNGDGGVPEETGMEKVLSDLRALKKLYGLLQRLDETSKALLKKLLDVLLFQSTEGKNEHNIETDSTTFKKNPFDLTTASDSVIPFSLGLTLTSPKKTDQTTPSSSSFLSNELPEEAETTEEISSDLQALTRLYMLLHKGVAADEDLDEASRALLMKVLGDATQDAVRRQAKMLSGSLVSPALERELSMRSDCRTGHADPRLRPVASPSPRPSLLASERSRQLNLQHSTVSSRSGLHADGLHHAAEEPEEPTLALARLPFNRSSRTTLPAARHRPSQEQRHSNLSLHWFSVAGTSRHGTVTGSTPFANRRDSIYRSSGRGDQWALESSSRRRSVRRRQEVLDKRVARLRMLKDKIGAVFHHRHDHHHHHHLGGGQEEGPSSRSRSVVRGAGHNSPWQFLTSMFHRAMEGKDKSTRIRTAVGVPAEKRRGGGGNMRALFDAVRRHLKGKRRAPAAGIKLRRKASLSRVRAKKMHWWQRLRRRRGMAGLTAGSRPRRRLGH